MGVTLDDFKRMLGEVQVEAYEPFSPPRVRKSVSSVMVSTSLKFTGWCEACLKWKPERQIKPITIDGIEHTICDYCRRNHYPIQKEK